MEFVNNKCMIASLLLAALIGSVRCFKASCLNAESSPEDSLTIVQCKEDVVTIEWNIHNDLQFVAFEYSCIHPTNSSPIVSNQSLPYWNDGQTGVTTVSPPGGALCLFSACYLDYDNRRHFVAPTSCLASSPTSTQEGSSLSSVIQTVTSDMYRVPSPLATPETGQLRVERGTSYRQRGSNSLVLVGSIGWIVLILLVVMASLATAGCLAAIQWRKYSRNKNSAITCTQVEAPMQVAMTSLDETYLPQSSSTPDAGNYLQPTEF